METVDSIVKDMGVSSYPPVVGRISVELEVSAKLVFSLERVVSEVTVVLDRSGVPVETVDPPLRFEDVCCETPVAIES